jgi:L-2,4-diaminobutyrate transaminase
MLAVELVEDRDDRIFYDPAKTMGAKVSAALLKQNVIARAMPQGDIIGFAPPLCLRIEETDIIVAAMKEALDSVC